MPKGANKTEMPLICFNMTTSEKDGFLQVLKDVKVPDWYSLNISCYVHLKQHKISSLKCHDDHILMQQLLPIALFRPLLVPVTRPLIKLFCFFREICFKTLSVLDLEILEKDITVTLCKLKKIFPPSFFIVMVHLVMHLASEVKIAGPIQYHWVYSIEVSQLFYQGVNCFFFFLIALFNFLFWNST